MYSMYKDKITVEGSVCCVQKQTNPRFKVENFKHKSYNMHNFFSLKFAAMKQFNEREPKSEDFLMQKKHGLPLQKKTHGK